MGRKRKKKKSMRERIRKNSRDSANKGVRYINAPDGIDFMEASTEKRMKLNILPYIVTQKGHPDDVEVGEEWYKRPFLLHRNVGVNNAAVVCPRSVGKKCPICEHQQQLYNEGETDKEAIKSLRPKERILYAVEVISGQKEKGLHLFEISKYNFQEKLDTEMNYAEDDDPILDFADAEGGMVLDVRFIEKTMGTYKFPSADKIDFRERDEDLSDKLLDSVPDLDDLLNILSYKQIQAMYFEVDDDELPDEEPEERPSRSRRRKDEDDEPEEDQEPEEDEAPPPKRRRRKPDPEDEEEEKPKRKRGRPKKEKDDDDEEEEKPKRRRGRPKKEKDDDEEEKPERTRRQSAGKCPYGHTWGDSKKDSTAHDDCDECAVFRSCVRS